MIDTTAKRRMTLDRKRYAKGDTVPMPATQFNDLGPDGIGFVDRAPAPKPEPAEATKPNNPKPAAKKAG